MGKSTMVFVVRNATLKELSNSERLAERILPPHFRTPSACWRHMKVNMFWSDLSDLCMPRTQKILAAPLAFD